MNNCIDYILVPYLLFVNSAYYPSLVFQVFSLLAACAQAPVPLSLVARVLGVQPDSRELEDVYRCALLSPTSAGLGDIETVSVHQVTRRVFMDLFLRNVSTSAGKGLKTNITIQAHIVTHTACLHSTYTPSILNTDFPGQGC